MVILSTVVPQGSDYLLGFDGNSNAHLWDIRRIVGREYSSQLSHGTSVYPELSKVVVEATVIQSKTVGDSTLLMCTYQNLMVANSQSLLSYSLDRTHQPLAPFDKLLFKVPNTVVQEHPHERQLFSTFLEQDGRVLLGFSSGAIGVFDLEQKQLVSKIPAPNSGGFHSKSNRHMITGLAQPTEYQLVAGSISGELYEIDLRLGRKIRNYTTSSGQATEGQLSPIVNLALVDRHLYVCHQDYISKWNSGLAKCTGIIEMGFNCSAMLPTSKGILVGGNVPYLYSISENDSLSRKWDISSSCSFAISEFEGLTTVAGTGSLVDVLNNTNRVCSLAATAAC